MTCGDPLGRALVAAGAGLARRAGDPAALAAELPFLGEYLAADALDQPLPAGPQHPLWRLAAAGITPLALDLLVAIGLVEEDFPLPRPDRRRWRAAGLRADGGSLRR